MAKVSVELEFDNPALYEDFMEAAGAAGLTPEAYLMSLLGRELLEVPFDGGIDDGSA